ncbi:Rhodanese-like protein [Sulfurimonas denitrificans DSM 1251]|jgi:thiosulfate/3-mercaptopyruvate sulfurtransferase|uniref:Rhodanese-like protein n=1 Tax=Sulfurimonas denitrificans (strain ATCC 33889 / DSM 1251) TaxID=326298 RepID=Q30TU2_SULDN|nr:rhodanese-like domain-containing protein [Sulfurimonas denitrificans]ABB43589.1 Rhodanese-like protein [Sulfurimonas denitrificans DSM 1251]MDD3443665.1 rhodanese-like domain-containing protein [Sulfurimonas denitrificans]
MKFVLILLFALHVNAYDAFIKPAQLNEILQENNLILLDVSKYSDYKKSHISGAIHTNISKFINNKYTGVSINFNQKIEDEMCNLGINENSHVVIYSRTNSIDYLNATYLASTFLQHGFENISILDGGYMAWVFKYNNKVTSIESKPLKNGTFKATYNPQILVDEEYLKDTTETTVAKSLKEIFFDDLTLRSEFELKKLFSNELTLEKERQNTIYSDTYLTALANWYVLYKMFDLKNMKIYKSDIE